MLFRNRVAATVEDAPTFFGMAFILLLIGVIQGLGRLWFVIGNFNVSPLGVAADSFLLGTLALLVIFANIAMVYSGSAIFKAIGQVIAHKLKG